MNETLGHIASAVKTELDKGGLGQFTVSARTTDDKAVSIGVEREAYNLSLIIRNEAAESSPSPYKKHIISVLEKFTPLTPYIDFKQPEPEKDHLKHLGEKFDGIRAKAAAIGLDIPQAYSDAFKERAKLEALRETASENVNIPEEHAVRVSRTDDRFDKSIKATFQAPGGVNAEELKASIEKRGVDIKALLGRMAAKKLTKDPAQQAAIIEKIKALDMVVTTKSGYWHQIGIEFRSPDVINAMKEPGGLQTLNAE
ncbi:MAG: hypothetical protein KGJ06_07675, partial [Pseudomonadota bacterium]|nr:hypothetical protein [Pseudomonadota bacterium]